MDSHILSGTTYLTFIWGGGAKGCIYTSLRLRCFAAQPGGLSLTFPTPAISLHPDDHSCSKPENDLMESLTSKHGYVKIHFILMLKCVYIFMSAVHSTFIQ